MAKQVWIQCPCCQEDHLLTPKRTVRGATTRKRRPSQSVKAKDEAWAKAIKQRDRKCLRCGTTESLQAAHIFTRSKRSVRWDLTNGVCLCAGHHLFWAHKEPSQFLHWVKCDVLGDERFEALQQRANQTQGRVKRAV